MTFGEAQFVLARAGVPIAPGLTDAEFVQLERRFGFTFPPDPREFLAVGLPTSGAWMDWRSADEAEIRARFKWPLEGINFDIENNMFWLDEWGERPASLEAALKNARRAVVEAPILIPLCSHRYIPATPSIAGNPVLSVHQSDIIYYGADLMDYLHNEFSYHFGRPTYSIGALSRRIPFWSSMVEENGRPPTNAPDHSR